MLLNSLLVAAGALAGVFARIYLTKVVNWWWRGRLPLATATLNLSGAFVLGLLSSLNVPAWAMLLAGTGFIGTYTTFSTMTLESFELLRRKRYTVCLLYFFTTFAGGLAAALIGLAIGHLIHFSFL
ncbi:MAG: CrcB family protein [Sporolactobacillus sp.]